MAWLMRIIFGSPDNELIDEVDLPVKGLNETMAKGEIEKQVKNGVWIGKRFVPPWSIREAFLVRKEDRLK